MSKSLLVGGKEYIPSSEAAKIFGYTSDYISRLAREKKIVAAYVNRKWFIEKTYFINFIQELEKEKKQRSLVLKEQRKTEQLLFKQKQKKQKMAQYVEVQTATMQTVAVIMCGIVIGLLGVIVSENNISGITLIQGARAMYTDISTPITNSMASMASVATYRWHAEQKNFAESPVSLEKQNISTIFSDEVIVEHAHNGEVIVYPVFKKEKNTGGYKVMKNIQK